MSAESIAVEPRSESDEFEIEPLFNRVMVERLEAPETYRPDSKILTPDTHKPKPQEGIVVAVGEDCRKLKVGQRVIFSKWSGVEPDLLEGKTIFILREEEIMAIRKRKGAETPSL